MSTEHCGARLRWAVFLPLNNDDVVHIRSVLDEIHQQFINTVLKGRRDRIVESAELFSGYVWTGERSLELGLVDALGSASYVAREVIGAEDIVDFTQRLNPLEQFARRLGATILEKLMGGLAAIH